MDKRSYTICRNWWGYKSTKMYVPYQILFIPKVFFFGKGGGRDLGGFFHEKGSKGEKGKKKLF